MTALALQTVKPWTPPAPVDLDAHRARYRDRLEQTVADIIDRTKEDMEIRRRGRRTIPVRDICSNPRCIRWATGQYLDTPWCDTCHPYNQTIIDIMEGN